MKVISATIIVSILFGVTISDNEFYKKFKVCSQDDPNRDDCIREGFQEFMKISSQGIPEVGIPSLDPFRSNRTVYNFNQSESEGRVEIKSSETVGISKAIVKKVRSKLDLENKKVYLNFDLKLPEIQTQGNYKANIVLNSQRLKPKGYFNLTAYNIDLKLKTVGEIVERDGREYAKVISIDLDPKIGDVKFYASGIAPDQSLNDMLITIANQNWRPYFNRIFPETKMIWQPMALNLANAYFDNVPLDQIFPKHMQN